MRKVIYAVSLAFTLGGASAVSAGEGCSYSQGAKKNDIEAPLPAAAVATPEKKG